jgi:hypothetical protein
MTVPGGLQVCIRQREGVRKCVVDTPLVHEPTTVTLITHVGHQACEPLSHSPPNRRLYCLKETQKPTQRQ